MAKLKRNSITKLNDNLINNKIKVDRRVLIKNRLNLNEPDIQMKWHVGYYDNLGDMFDVVSTNNIYTLNRNDLVGYSQLNSNLFSFAPILTTSLSSIYNLEDDKNSPSVVFNEPARTNSLMANSLENAFTLKTNRPGRFIMELTPSLAVNAIESRDYLGLSINEFDADSREFNSYHTKLEASIGDFICLNARNEDLSDDDDFGELEGGVSGRDGLNSNWLSQSTNLVKIIPTSSVSDKDKQDFAAFTHFGLCLSEGF